MWTVLFGEQDEPEAGAGAGAPQPQPQRSEPAPTPTAEPTPKPQPAVPPSPAFTAPMTPSPPGSSRGAERRASAARSTFEAEEEEDQSPMAMLLKRMNRLMVKVGEHEFEKKTLVDTMEKERARLQEQIHALERQIEDLKDQNVQLQYKMEFASDPMLLERLQDATDMRDALTDVKGQLEAEIQQKDRELKECKDALSAKDEELERIKSEFERRVQELVEECERAKQQAEHAEALAQEVAAVSFQKQLEEKEELAESMIDARDALEAQLADKSKQLEESQESLQDATAKYAALAEEVEQLTARNEQLEQQAQIASGAHYDSSELLQTRVDELVALKREQDDSIHQLQQELEDYKHDCAGLWEHNEDLKHQIEQLSAASVANQGASQQPIQADQSALQAHAADLEQQLEQLRHQLAEMTEALNTSQAKTDSVTADFGISELSLNDDTTVGWESNTIRMLTDQAEAAQRELSDAMELNLHLSNRNTWLEEQYKHLVSGSVVGDENDDDAILVPAGDSLFANGNIGDVHHHEHDHEQSYHDELMTLQQTIQDREQHIMELDNNYAALSHEFEQLKDLHNQLVEVKQIDDATMTQLTLDLNEATAFVERLRESNSNLTEDIEELKQQLETEQHDTTVRDDDRVSSLEAELSRVRNEFEQLTDLYNQLVEVKQIDDSTMTQLTLDLNEATAYIEQLRSSSSQMTQEIETLKQQLEAERHDSSARDDERVVSLESELARLQSTQQKLTTLLEAANADKNEKEIALQAIEQKLAEIRANGDAQKHESGERLNALELELSRTKGDLQEMQQEFAEAENTNLRLGLEVEEWRERFENAANDKDSASQVMQQQLDQTNAAVTNLQAELTAAKGALLSVLSEKQQVEESVAVKLEQARQELTSLSSEKQQVEEDASVKYERLRQELSALTAEKQALVDEKSAALNELELRLSQELAGAKHALATEKQSLEQQIQNLHEVNQESMESSMELQERLEVVEEELLQCKTQLESANAECESLKQVAEDQKRAALDVQAVRGELNHLQQQLQQQNTIVERLKQSNEELSQQLESAHRDREQSENARMQTAANAERANMAATDMQRENEELSATLDKTRAKLVSLEQQAERAGEDQRAIQMQLEALSKKNHSLVAEIEHLREQFDTEAKRSKNEKESAQREIEELRRAQHTDQEQQRALAAEFAKAREELRTVHDLASHSQNEKNALAQETERLRALCMEQQDSRQGLEERAKELEHALDDARHAVEQLEEKLASAEGFAVHLEEEAHMEIGRLHEVNGALQAELEHVIMARHDDADAHDELRMKLAELQAENNVLAARAHRLTEQLSQYTDLPDEDRLAASQTATPDLWELLSSGMEQLKADLELASKYASSMEVNGSTNGSVVDGDEAFAIPS